MKIKGRNESSRQQRKKILIVCEGQRTEPSYFSNFRVAKHVCDVHGIGMNTLSLVKRAVLIRDKRPDEYSEVWCVFDRDSFSRKDVLAAFRLAKENGFKCAFSNESFELWYVLHFCYLDTEITRDDYCEKLDKFLNRKYKKNDPDIFEALVAFQPQAIRNAERLRKVFAGVDDFNARPSTTVHLLVKRLNDLERKAAK